MIILYKEAILLGAIEKLEKLFANPILQLSDVKKKNGLFFASCVANRIDLVIEYLKDEEIDVNYRREEGMSPFFISCSKGNIQIVKELLKHSRIQKNQTNLFDETPFFIACKNNHIDVVIELLNYNQNDSDSDSDRSSESSGDGDKIDIQKQNGFEETGLFISCKEGHLEIVQLLLKDQRIDVNKSNKNEDTPLMVSWEKRKLEITKELLKCSNINVNLVNRKRKSFLFMVQSNLEIIKLLLRNGTVNIRAKFQGKTIFETKNKEILSLLKAYDTGIFLFLFFDFIIFQKKIKIK